MRMKIQLVKDIKLKDSIFKIASSWDELTEHNLKNAWNKILRDDDTFEHKKIDAIDIVIRKLVNSLPGNESLTCEEILLWTHDDDCGWKELSNSEILTRYSHIYCQSMIECFEYCQFFI